MDGTRDVRTDPSVIGRPFSAAAAAVCPSSGEYN